MALMDIRVYGDPVLRTRAEEIEVFDEQLEEFATDMVETMLVGDGVGLAAPQVGVSKRMIVIGVPGEDEEGQTQVKILILVNPVITEETEETSTVEEGCLSLPGLTVEVDRPVEITVRFQNLKGETHEIEADEFTSRVIQHEMDHLDGNLLVDYLTPLKRSLIKNQLKEITEAGPIKLTAKRA